MFCAGSAFLGCFLGRLFLEKAPVVEICREFLYKTNTMLVRTREGDVLV